MLAPAGLCALALAACGSSSGLTQTGGTTTSAMSMAMPGSSGSSTAVPEVNGVKPIPIQQLASAQWQGMKIQAQTSTPIPFVVFDGTRERKIKPGKHTSFHLMVMLNDAHTGVAIPYSTVWATVLKGGKVVYDERQWPMISAYMGPHYGNDVSLPGAGRYTLKLLISPPISARHVEYQHVWLKPHRVTMSFNWHPPK